MNNNYYGQDPDFYGQDPNGNKGNFTRILLISCLSALIILMLLFILFSGMLGIGKNESDSGSDGLAETSTVLQETDPVIVQETTTVPPATSAEVTQTAEPPSISDIPSAVTDSAVPETPVYGYSSEYILPDSSTEYIYFSDLNGFSKWECSIARNEIYARHGRRFKDNDLQSYFDRQSWYYGYISPSDFNEGMLNSIEKENIKTIKAYEKEHGYQ